MFKQKKLHYAIVSAMAATAGTGVANAAIEEVVVTASKRATSMQDVPITVQAMQEDDLKEQRIDSFDDYVKYLPGVTFGGRGPGQNTIYVRGVAVNTVNTTLAEANGNEPNVGLYLDEQPVTANGRNLDVYVSDMARIEVLPGPQGTLYGASSMAGTVRLITNKPQINAFEASFSAKSGFTKDGDMSNAVEGVLNFPVIDDKLAVRVAMFSDHQGGYIDNVQGTFTADPDMNPVLAPKEGITFVPAGGSPTAHQFADGSFAVPGQTYPVEYQSKSNGELVEENFNDATYSGFRVGAKYIFNENWDLLIQHHQQTINADGVFDYDPRVGDLEVQRFNPDTLRDEFGQTSWTVNGRIGELELLYTGAYLNRDLEQNIDYANYANTGLYIRGYMCEYNTPGYHGGGGAGYTFDPTLSGDPGVVECTQPGAGFAAIENEFDRITHEARIVTDQTRRFRFTGGLFYEDYESLHTADFMYGDPDWATVKPQRLNPITANERAEKSPKTQFVNDITRPQDQIAAFGELTVDLIPSVSATVGVRWYEIEVGFEGFSAFKYGNRPVPNLANGNNANGIVLEADGDDTDGTSLAPDITGGRDYIRNIGDFQPVTVDDVISKFTLNWVVNNDLMVYGTFSDSFRPPGFNRAVAAGPISQTGGGACPVATSPATANDGEGGFPDYCIPLIYDSDEVENLEIGWKATLFNGMLRFNGSAYQIDWTDIQVGHIDSQRINFLAIVDNAGDAEINGIEGDLTWLATPNFTVHGAFSFNDTEITSLNPAFAFAITDVGNELPLAPELQFSARGRYQWDVGGGTAHAQLALQYADESWSSIVDDPPRREKQDSYVITNAQIGFKRDDWTIALYADNLGDERAQLHINTLDGSRKITTNRPRTIGLRVSYQVY